MMLPRMNRAQKQKKRRSQKGRKIDQAIPVVFNEAALLSSADAGYPLVCTPYGLRVHSMKQYKKQYTGRAERGVRCPDWHFVYRLGRKHRVLVELEEATTFLEALQDMHKRIGRVGTGGWDYNSLRVQLHDGSLMWFDHAQVLIEKIIAKLTYGQMKDHE